MIYLIYQICLIYLIDRDLSDLSDLDRGLSDLADLGRDLSDLSDLDRDLSDLSDLDRYLSDLDRDLDRDLSDLPLVVVVVVVFPHKVPPSTMTGMVRAWC